MPSPVIGNPVSGGLPSLAPEALPVYVTFGRFQLLARLGKGGMGDVFLASVKGMEGFNKLVVIKRLREALSEEAEMRALFLAEGRLAARLNHPNVVQTNEVGEELRTLYLSMEYLEGQPLSEINRKFCSNAFDPVLAARIVSEALAGLHYAHELRDYDGTPLHIVHRDISPQNIFITYEGVTKVVDFGVAKVAWQVGSKTQDGVLKGKVTYMAPEHVSGTPDRRSDIFAMGIVLWELIARKRLMADSSVVKVLHRVVNERPPRVSEVTEGVHPMLDGIIARALEKDPAQRFQTAQEMRDALEAYIAASGRFVRQEDVAQLLQSLFKNRRERVRKQVQASMEEASETSSLLNLPPLASKKETGTSSVSRPHSLEGSTPPPRLATQAARGAQAKDGHQASKSSLMGGVIIALLAAVSLLAGMKTRPAPPEAPSTRPTALQPALKPEAVVAAPAEKQPASVATAHDPEPFSAQPEPFPAQPESAKRSVAARRSLARAPAPHPVAPPPAAAAPPASSPEPSAAPLSPPRKRKFRTEF